MVSCYLGTMPNNKELKRILQQLADFLEDYLPLANSHNTDFLTHNHWQRLIPRDIRTQLLHLDDESLSAMPTIPPPLELTGNEDEHFTSEILTEQKSDLQGCGALMYDDSCLRKDLHGRPEWNKCLTPTWRHTNLHSFVSACQAHTLQGLGVLQSMEELVQQWQAMEADQSVFVDSHMSAKKSHEVEVMAQVCASVSRKQQTHTVVDIGSGRGYLSCHLSQMYGLNVLGIDSSSGNTHSAQSRSTKLKKHWKGLVRNAEREKAGPHVEQPGSPADCQQTAPSANTSSVNTVSTDIFAEGNIVMAKEHNEAAGRGTQETIYGLYMPVTYYVQPSMDLTGLLNNHLYRVTHDIVNHKTSIYLRESTFKNSAACFSNPLEVDSQTERDFTNCEKERNIQKGNPISSVGCENQMDRQPLNNPEHGREAQHCLTTHVPYGCNGVSSVEGAGMNTSSNFVMTGLHTCGGLAASVLKLYLANEHATALVNVGCCYNFIEEEFVANPFNLEDAVEPEITFPLSNILRHRHYKLGRNVRLVACQAVDRVKANCKVPEESLFNRALLQVILYDITGELREDWKVGRIAAKTKTFEDYVMKCLRKLSINHSLTTKDIVEYAARYEHHSRCMQAFFQLKMALAPCIEALILLDRLVFLREQAPDMESYLVRMFDPVTSPRCYGIISLKQP